MGHADGSVGARYSYVTPAMRQALCSGLTDRWNVALRARKALYRAHRSGSSTGCCVRSEHRIRQVVSKFVSKTALETSQGRSPEWEDRP